MITFVCLDVNLSKFKTFPKKSKVNVNASDREGWTVMHHIVCPLEYGTFDNIELAKILANAGAPLNRPNNAGETPLEMAVRTGATKLTQALQILLDVSKDTWVNIALIYMYFRTST